MKITYKVVSTDLIDMNPINPDSRINTNSDNFRKLQNAICLTGNKILLNLVVVERPDGRFLLIDGHRRKTCADILEIKEVSCSIVTLEDNESPELVYKLLNLSQMKLSGRQYTEIYMKGGNTVLSRQQLSFFTELEVNSEHQDIIKRIDEKNMSVSTFGRTMRGISNYCEKRNKEDKILIINYILEKGNATLIRDSFRNHTPSDLWSKIMNKEDL